MENNLFKVLWVEDDPIVTESYPLEAENYDLYLVPFRCWREAESALKENISQWDAVILDAKCKLEPDSPENAVSFLLNAQTSLMTICKEKNRHINYYILSGGAENEINDCILDTNVRYWDKDMHKKYYSKETDREILFRRIRAHMRESQHYQIRSMFYKPVFDAIQETGLNPEMNVIMEDLLTPLHFSDITDKDYNNRFGNIRKGLEYIFRSMIAYKILPEEVRTITRQKDEINLSWSSLFLSGKPNEKLPYGPKETVFPRIISNNVMNMIFAPGSYLHTNDPEYKQYDTTSYLHMVDDSSFLIRSYSLQLCDIIVWYKNYLREHSDPEQNRSNWTNH